jgi:hypothetical protein
MAKTAADTGAAHERVCNILGASSSALRRVAQKHQVSLCQRGPRRSCRCRPWPEPSKPFTHDARFHLPTVRERLSANASPTLASINFLYNLLGVLWALYVSGDRTVRQSSAATRPSSGRLSAWASSLTSELWTLLLKG